MYVVAEVLYRLKRIFNGLCPMCLSKNVMSAELDAVFRVKNTSDLRLNGNTSAQESRRHQHLGQILEHDELT